MAWTTPRTWVAGELVTEALMNTYVRDNQSAIVATTGAYVNAVTGPHAIGGSTVDYVRLGLTGAFTSGGASTVAFGTYTSGVLTGHSGDSAAIAGVKLNNTVVTAGNCTTIAQLWVSEPQITVGAGTVTNSATVYIEGAASEATNDYALWVDAGATRLDGGIEGGLAVSGDLNVDSGGLFVESDNSYVGLGTTSPASALHVTTAVAAAGTHMKGIQLSPTVTGATGGWEIYGIACYPTIVESADGSNPHGNTIGMLVAPTMTNGTAVTTAATGLQVSSFAAATGTVTATGLRVYAPTSATNNVGIYTNGRVGIGTTTPLDKLEVSGAIVVSGAYTAHQTSALVMSSEGDVSQFAAYGPDATTQGSFQFVTKENDGGNTIALNLYGSGAVFNTSAVDKNFVVKSDDDANCFNLDGGNDNIGIGVAPGAGEAKLHVNTTGNALGFQVSQNISGEIGVRINGGGTAQAHALAIRNGSDAVSFAVTDSGVIQLKETSSAPASVATFGMLYALDDDTLGYRDGNGTAHTLRYD